MAKNRNRKKNEEVVEDTPEQTPEQAVELSDADKAANEAIGKGYEQFVGVGLTKDGKLGGVHSSHPGYGPLTYILSRALFFIQAHELNATNGQQEGDNNNNG